MVIDSQNAFAVMQQEINVLRAENLLLQQSLAVEKEGRQRAIQETGALRKRLAAIEKAFGKLRAAHGTSETEYDAAVIGLEDALNSHTV